MKKRKVPMRKDIVTGEMMPKRELIRVVRNKEDEVSVDPTGKKA
ncbi:YlxR family protein, partial [Anaerostipes hadrus]